MIYNPLDHHRRMTGWMLDRPESALFAGCGLGKTGATLAALDRRIVEGESRGALIVCPIRVGLITWPNEVEKWDQFRWMKVANLRFPEGRESWEKGTADIYLCNPEQLPKMRDLLFKRKGPYPVDTFVWDELSQAKNHASKRVRAIRPYLPRFKHRIGLTGTPVPNTYLDLFGQIRLLDDGARLGRSYDAYRKQHFESDYMGFKWNIRPGAKEKIDARLSDLALVMESGDYLDVPQVTAVDLDVVLDAESKRLYRTMEKELLIELERSDVSAPTMAALTTKLIQLTAGMVYGDDGSVNHVHRAKLDRLLTLGKEYPDEPLLILSMYRHEKARILAEFPGAVEFHEKHVPAFRAGRIRALVAHPAQMSHGIDGLQDSCRIAVWASLTYSNEQYVQTNARLIRTGQTRETRIFRLVVPESIDDAVAEALREKSDNQSGLMQALKNLQRLHHHDR